ncbi:MAG: hypothetical protein ACR5LG_15395 [Sodalis sp. (in: enterobacteria)]|uniref:hypothetical protein n=1 Tax=Sodalis sp. (in: enterobacteria) TaxID=1898979 RepID=UPI003F2DCAC4
MSKSPLQPGHPPLAREVVRDLRFSAIRDVANASIGRDDVLPFWFGEATPRRRRSFAPQRKRR